MRRWLIKISLIMLCLMVLTSCGRDEDDDGLQEVSQVELEPDEEEDEEDGARSSESEGSTDGTGAADSSIYVHVCGEVVNPGVYPLAAGSRLFEAVEQAGGFTDEAQQASVNLAEFLEDGQQVYIPSKDEAKELAEQAQDAADGKVNLNTASREELMTLSGIGESKADAIIQYREEQGRFQSIEELMEIPGIKEGVFQKVKDRIKIE